MALTAVKPDHFPWFDYSSYSFSLGLDTGNGIYLSGHTASEYDIKSGRIVIRGGMTEQARTAYAKIGSILEAAKKSYGDVVRIVEYVKPEGIERYAEAAAVRNEVFGKHHPAVNTVPVKALLRPDAFIEIEVTAGDLGAETSFGSGLPIARDSGGVVFLPTIQAVDEDGNILGKGDVAAQTRIIFEKAEQMLKTLGLGFDRVVKTLDYIKPSALSEYRGTGRVRKEFLGPVYPGAAGILMPNLLHPDALIQYDFIATRNNPVAINPGWERYKKLTYSPGVKAGNLLFLSGQGSLNPENGEIEHQDDVVGQAEYTYSNIFKVIEAAGGKRKNLVKTIEYVTPAAMQRYREVGKLRAQLMPKPYPAATGLICEMLLRPEMQIEVDPFAILD